MSRHLLPCGEAHHSIFNLIKKAPPMICHPLRVCIAKAFYDFRLLLLLFSISMCPTPCFASEFECGIKAFEHGDFTTATKIILKLCGKNDKADPLAIQSYFLNEC